MYYIYAFLVALISAMLAMGVLVAASFTTRVRSYVLARLMARPSFRRSVYAALDLENVGFGLALFGGIIALVVVLLLIYAPSALPLIDNEVIALIALILVVAGLIVHAAD